MISCFTLLSKEEGKLLSFIKIQLSNFASKNIFLWFSQWLSCRGGDCTAVFPQTLSVP